MERRRFTLNLTACIVAGIVAFGCILTAYFQYRARESEAAQMRDVSEMMQQAVEMGKESMKESERLEKLDRQLFPSR